MIKLSKWYIIDGQVKVVLFRFYNLATSGEAHDKCMQSFGEARDKCMQSLGEIVSLDS